MVTCFGFRVSGFRSVVSGSVFGSRVSGLGFWVFRLQAPGVGLRGLEFGFLFSGFWFLVSGFWFRASGFGGQDSVSNFGFRVLGFGFRVLHREEDDPENGGDQDNEKREECDDEECPDHAV